MVDKPLSGARRHRYQIIMRNRKRAPALAHLAASFMGMGLDPELAKDYWLGKDEPWNATHDVTNRFAKLAYMYSASAVVQIGVPIFLLIAISSLIRTPRGAPFQIPSMAWRINAVLMLCGIATGLLMAFFAWRRIKKQRRATES